MHKVLTIVCCFIILAGCKKNEPVGIEIRAENSTNVAIDSVQLMYDNSQYNYGTVQPGDTTGYHFYETLIDATATTFVLDGHQILAGGILPPNPPYPHLSDGKYILRIFADSLFPTGYNAEFIKE